MLEMKKPSDLKVQGGLFLIYGPTGAGKTVLLGSIAELMPTIIISTEPRGTVSLADFGYNPDVVEVTRTEEAEEVMRFLVEEEHKYKAVGLDTITEFQLVLSDEVLREAVKTSAGRRVEHSPFILELRDWQPILVRVWRFIRNLQALSNDMIIIVTAQVTEAPDPMDRKSLVYTPLLRGQWRTLIGAYFDLVGYLDTDTYREGKETKIVRLLHTQPLGNYIAKSRYALPPVIENPTMRKILNLIRGRELIEKAEKAIKELYE